MGNALASRKGMGSPWGFEGAKQYALSMRWRAGDHRGIRKLFRHPICVIYFDQKLTPFRKSLFWGYALGVCAIWKTNTLGLFLLFTNRLCAESMRCVKNQYFSPVLKYKTHFPLSPMIKSLTTVLARGHIYIYMIYIYIQVWYTYMIFNIYIYILSL